MAELGFISNYERVKPDDELPFFLRDSKVHLWNSHDVDGRPFGELLASEAARKGVEFEVRPAKYPGVRNGTGVNLSGLRPMTKFWDEIIADTDFVRSRFMARYGLKELTYLHVWQLGKVLADLSSFIYVRRGHVSEGIPVRISGMFRAIIGVVSVCEGLITRGTSPLAPASTGPIVALAEEGAFLSNGGRSCAAPIHMVEQFTDTVIHGAKASGPSAVEELVGDVDLFLRYAELSLLWDLTSQLYRAKTRVLADRAMSLLAGLARQSRDAAQARREPWTHATRSAIYHLDLGFFSPSGTALESAHVAGIVPLLEMVLGGFGVPLAAPKALNRDGLERAIAARLPWTSADDATALSSCWADYLALENQISAILFQLQQSTTDDLRTIEGTRSPLCHSTGPRWLTNRDFSMRLGATLGDAFELSFGARVDVSRDGALDVKSPHVVIE